MKVTDIGSGYVGPVGGACLAEMGKDVVCVDVDARKIAMLDDGRVSIHEPGLRELVTRNASAGGCTSRPTSPPRCNLYDTTLMKELGIEYRGIGRSTDAGAR